MGGLSLKRYSVFTAIAFFAFAMMLMPFTSHAATEDCPITIDNDTSDWEDVDALVDEEGDTVGVDWYWTGSEWTSTEPDSYQYSTNVQQMADLETIKMCNDITSAYLYVDAQHPMFGVFNTTTNEYEEFGDPEDEENEGPEGMPEDFDYWMVYELQKEGSSSVYYYGIHLVAEEGDYGMTDGPTHFGLYEDDGDGEFDPNVDEELAEFEDSNDNIPEEGEDGGKEFDQEGGLEVTLDLINEDGVGVFTETDISYGDTVNITVAMYLNSDFSTSAVRSVVAADETDAFEYQIAREGVENVQAKKKKRKRKKVTVQWDEVEAASKYRVALYNRKLTKRLRVLKTTNTKKVVKRLKPNRKYKVKVRAIMSGIKSPWSDPVQFKTKKKQ